MKKVFIFIFIAIGFVFNSCSSYVEGLDKSPNRPTDVPLNLLNPVAQVSVFSTYTGQLARIASIFTQQSTGRQFQYVQLENYDINENDVDNDWQQIYNTGLINAQTMIDKAGDHYKAYRGIGKVLKAMNLGIATDYWGDIPNSEALLGLQGEANFNPKFDAQSDVINDIQKLLDEAIADFGASGSDLPLLGVDDLIYGGDSKRWIGAANVLKARYANRLSKRDPAGSATKALAALNAAYASGFTSSAGNAYAIFSTSENELNQWFAFNRDRAGYMTMGKTLMAMLNSNSDPRTSFYATKFNGAFTDSSIIGSLYGSADSKLPLITYAEAKFIEAEANLRAGNSIAAATASNDAIKASVLNVTGASAPAFENAVANETAATISIDKIMNQKYVAMFTQPEVWADWRRTGIPSLTPSKDAVIAGIPQRLPTAQSERLYNTKAVVVSDLLKRVWWAE